MLQFWLTPIVLVVSNLFMVRATIVLLASLTLLIQVAAAQVETSIRLTKQEYLAGEPIVLLIEVKNIGEDMVAYGGGCDFDVEMSILGVDRKRPFDKDGCFVGRGQGGSCGASSHPPGLAIGQSVIFRHLLTGYRLGPGNYTLKATGKVPLFWWLFATKDPAHKPGLPVVGDRFSGNLEFLVRDGSDDELKQAFAPWTDDAKGIKSSKQGEAGPVAVEDSRWFAKRAIMETAPPLLEDFILALVKEDSSFTITALQNMNTSSSRRALVQMFEESKDAEFRSSVVSALREIANPEQADFFSTLLTAENASVQKTAIMAMGRIGGWRGVQELQRIQSNDASVNEAINTALSITRSADAVPVLIERYGQETTRDGVCDALATLTHRAWCAVLGDDPPRDWMELWGQHGASMRIYGDDDCSGALNPQPLPGRQETRRDAGHD
jgi:hypothetical protein